MSERLILVTNDDSYKSTGIAAAIEVAREFGRVIVIAPDSPQSGKSQAVTMEEPLFFREISKSEGVEIYSFSGTPVDCMKFAFDHYLKDQKIDLVISGINHGSNAAINVMYSGTMGAAIEGSLYNIPSIGLSLCDYKADADFEASKFYAKQIISSVLESDVEMPLCLNVNFPKGEVSQIKGVKVCRQCRGYWQEKFFCNRNPRNQDYYWLTGEFVNMEKGAVDTDEWALENGYVSVVPVQVDLTEYKLISKIDSVLNG